eukprot:gene25800-biopygen20291
MVPLVLGGVHKRRHLAASPASLGESSVDPALLGLSALHIDRQNFMILSMMLAHMTDSLVKVYQDYATPADIFLDIRRWDSDSLSSEVPLLMGQLRDAVMRPKERVDEFFRRVRGYCSDLRSARAPVAQDYAMGIIIGGIRMARFDSLRLKFGMMRQRQILVDYWSCLGEYRNLDILNIALPKSHPGCIAIAVDAAMDLPPNGEAATGDEYPMEDCHYPNTDHNNATIAARSVPHRITVVKNAVALNEILRHCSEPIQQAILAAADVAAKACRFMRLTYGERNSDLETNPAYSTTPIRQLPTVPFDDLCNLTEAQARIEMDLMLDQARTAYEDVPCPIDGQGSCTQTELSQALS